MKKKLQGFGSVLSRSEMKSIKGGTGPKTRWACHTQPDNPSWIDYICYNGKPPCHYTCTAAGTCQPNDYTLCVS